MTADSGQLDLVDVLSDQLDRAEGGLDTFEETLNPQIDANPEDKLLMEMLDAITDARESVSDVRELLEDMRKRDLQDEL
jgi:hypothetical protein